ncbi:MAG: heme-binding protein [Planctomycetota bacterium]
MVDITDAPEVTAHAPVKAMAVGVLAAGLNGGDPMAAAEAAADLLGPEWIASAELLSAGSIADVQAVHDRLAFTPILEAEFPPNFPDWTPVGEIEIKQYPTYRMAIAKSEVGLQENGLFWRLFNHISTNDIPMTAPVEMSRDNGKAMMGFMYPDSDTGSLGSAALDVEVIDVPPTKVITVGMRGNRRTSDVDEVESMLRNAIEERGLTAAGPMRVMGYNSPSVRGDMRYYEVQIPVE